MVIDFAGEDSQNRVEHFRRGDPKSVAEFTFDSVCAQVAAQSLASAMNDHGFVPGLDYGGNLGREPLPGFLFFE